MGLADDARLQQNARQHQDAQEALHREWQSKPLISEKLVELAELCLGTGQAPLPFFFQKFDKNSMMWTARCSKLGVDGWIAESPQGYLAFSPDGRIWRSANYLAKTAFGDFPTNGLPRGRWWVVDSPRSNFDGEFLGFDVVEAAGEVLNGRMIKGVIPMSEHTARRVRESKAWNR